MKYYLDLILLLFVCGFLFSRPVIAQTGDTYVTLAGGFEDPPASARPYVYHWWLGGDVDTIRLKEEIRAFKKAGISGFTIFEIGSSDTAYIKAGPPFLGPESLASIRCAVDEAGKLGMRVGLNTASSWNAGGTWITPEYAAKSIYESIVTVKDGPDRKIRMPFPSIPETDAWGKKRLIEYSSDGKPVFYREIAVLAFPVTGNKTTLDTATIIDMTGSFHSDSETLDWMARPGEWEIHRYICSNSGENLVLPSRHSAGPIIDHYDANATTFHFTYIINKLESVLGNLRRTALKSLYMASYEAKGFTWTTTLPEVFKKINGYPVGKWIPALFNESAFSPADHAKFMVDFNRTLSELMISNFYKKAGEICHAYGLLTNSEAGGPGYPLHHVPVEPLKALGSLDIPRGEFWINHSRYNALGIDILRVVKEVSAASHIYNRDRVEMEAFTTFQHWQEAPVDMKPRGDRAFCEGMNKVVVHGSSHNPAGTGVPGIVYGAGTHYNDKRVWWPMVRPFNDYLARISYILQETAFMADVLYYYGDTIPNYGGHKNSRFTAGPGYDYEIINTEKLKELTVRHNKLFLPGINSGYAILVLTREQEMEPTVLLKLRELSDHGAVILGPRPERVIERRNGSDREDLSGLITRLWGRTGEPHSRSGETGILEGISPGRLLEDMDVKPDFDYPGSEYLTLDYIHYAKEDLDFYFIRNSTDRLISRECLFRQKNRIPEIWDPVSGNIIPVTIFDQEGTLMALPLTLGPYESTFVVFKKGTPGFHYTTLSSESTALPRLEYSREGICIPDDGIFQLGIPGGSREIRNVTDTRTLTGAWEVFFPEGSGLPERLIFPELKSWSESAMESLRYFSGTATYKKIFKYPVIPKTPENGKTYLDLGELSKIAEVWLNGRQLGVAWTRPFRFDITGLLNPGENHLVVRIANTWSNRLTGDAITGAKNTSTNIKATMVDGLNQERLAWKDVPLIRSGLFGPVKLIRLMPVQ